MDEKFAMSSTNHRRLSKVAGVRDENGKRKLPIGVNSPYSLRVFRLRRANL
jgi:hypothetical protein